MGEGFPASGGRRDGRGRGGRGDRRPGGGRKGTATEMAAAIDEFGRRANGDGDRSPASSLLLLPSNLQCRCMKYLVFLAIYTIFLYPLGVQKISVLFWSGLFSP